MRLFQRLEDWEAGHAARRAFLLSGADAVSPYAIAATPSRRYLPAGGTPCALQTELASRRAQPGNATAAALRAAAPAPAPLAQPRRQLLIHACGPVTAFSSVLSELLAFIRHRETSESTAEPHARSQGQAYGGARVTRLRRDRRRRNHSQTHERRRRRTSSTSSCAARSTRTTPTRTPPRSARASRSSWRRGTPSRRRWPAPWCRPTGLVFFQRPPFGVRPTEIHV